MPHSHTTSIVERTVLSPRWTPTLPATTRGSVRKASLSKLEDRLAPGTRIGRFTLEERLGKGGFGIVYKAAGPDGKPVALKLSPPEHFAPLVFEAHALHALRGTTTAIPDFNCAQLTPIPISGADETSVIYLGQELVQGTTLQGLLASGTFTPLETVRIIRDICRGLAVAARKGFCHFDLKPGNIMITPEGKAVIIDWGFGRRGTAPGRIMGTVNFMPPEQMLGRALDIRADVYALGILSHLMLGNSPFLTLYNPDDQGTFFTLLSEKNRFADSPPAHGAGTPRMVSEFFNRLIHPEPDCRPASYDQIILGLDALEATFTDTQVVFPSPHITARRDQSAALTWMLTGIIQI